MRNRIACKTYADNVRQPATFACFSFFLQNVASRSCKTSGFLEIRPVGGAVTGEIARISESLSERFPAADAGRDPFVARLALLLLAGRVTLPQLTSRLTSVAHFMLWRDAVASIGAAVCTASFAAC